MIGIYKITNPLGKIYIGQSKNIKNRWATHRYNINKNVRIWGRLYDSFIEYGIENHVFEIVELCDISSLDCKERYYQEKYNSYALGLNSVLNKSKNKKSTYNNDSKQKMSEKGKIKIFSEQHRLNLSKKSKGELNPKARIVLNIQNGIFYNTMKEAANAYGFIPSKLSVLIRDENNKTNLIYV